VSEAYFLVGPTAAGKSRIAQQIAEGGGYEIISADSMLVYRDMEIGTDKPAVSARGDVAYHGIDLVAPDALFTVWDYRRAAVAALSAIAARGNRAIVVGGTGLYIKALVAGLDPSAEPDAANRARWTELLEEGGVKALQRALQRMAPVAYDGLADPENPRRLVRALERAEAGQEKPPAAWRGPESCPVVAGISMAREDLNSRIESRVHSMYDRGILEEARGLLRKYGALSRTAAQAIGYAEAIACIEGTCSRDEAIERTIVRTRRLAKRQRTWFRHQLRVDWVDITEHSDLRNVAESVRRTWSRHGGTVIAAEA